MKDRNAKIRNESNKYAEFCTPGMRPVPLKERWAAETREKVLISNDKKEKKNK